jgi:KaiC/GvpD/RAD55 family RecA-like ATPase
MERISTGIEELDRSTGGGYPKGKGVLITGSAGSGKTIVALHFIHKGCMDGRRCVYIATEEELEDLLYQSENVGLDIRPYFDSGLLKIIKLYEERAYTTIQTMSLGFEKIDSLQSDIISLVEKIPKDCELVVVDNLGVFTLNMSMDEFRKQLDTLNLLLAKKGYTTLYIMDDTSNMRTEGVATYSVHGVIKLTIKDNPYTNMKERHIEISKMRATKISLESNVFEITSKGILIHKKKGGIQANN